MEKMTRDEFLQKQLHYVAQVGDRMMGEVTWADVSNLRAAYYSDKRPESEDTVRKGAKMLREYMKADWIKKPEDVVPVNEDEMYEETAALDKKPEKPRDFRKTVSRLPNGDVEVEDVFVVEDDTKLADDEYLMKMHKYDPALWQVKNSRSSIWDTQIKGGTIETLYASKLTVEPRKNVWSIEDIDAYMETKEFRNPKEIHKPTNYNPKGEILEIALPDLHGGLLAWKKETQDDDYDMKITKELFYSCLSDIIDRCRRRGQKFRKIYLVPLGDLLHADSFEGMTSSRKVVLDVDGRFSKYFDLVLDMIIDGIELLASFCPVEVPYISGNHDRLSGYALMKAVDKAFRKDKRVTIDCTPSPRKYRQLGNVLVGWCHGDMPKQNISEWLQVEARKEFGDTVFAEVHAGHYHSQQTVEKSGMIIRYLPTICPASSWEHMQGYNKSVRTVVSFVWNTNLGLREMWFSNI